MDMGVDMDMARFLLFRFVRMVLGVSVISKHRNKLFRYWNETMETDVLFWIVPKLVSVISKRK